MTKYILLFLVLSMNTAYAHNLSLKDRQLMSHSHDVISVNNVTANDSLKIWTDFQKTEYNENIKSDYKIKLNILKKNLILRSLSTRQKTLYLVVQL